MMLKILGLSIVIMCGHCEQVFASDAPRGSGSVASDYSYFFNDDCEPNNLKTFFTTAEPPSTQLAINCFEDRKADNADEKDEFYIRANSNKIETELYTCNCLKKNKISGFDSLREENVSGARLSEKELLVNNAKLMNSRLDILANEMMVQASQLTNEKDLGLIMAKSYGQYLDPLKTQINEQNKVIKKTLIAEKHLSSSDIEKLNLKIIIPEFNQSILEVPQYSAKQCFSLKNYIRFNQVPQSNSFYESLSDAEYNEDDWDIKNLRKSFQVEDELYRREKEKNTTHIPPENLKRLTAKLEFLTYNPMIKNLFAARDSRINDDKKEMFNLIKKTFSPVKKCISKRNECQHQIVHSDSLEEFRKQMVIIFTKQNVIPAVRNYAYDETKRETGKLQEILLKTAYHDPQTSSRDDTSLNKCFGREALESKNDCVKKFQDYCKKVSSYASEVANKFIVDGQPDGLSFSSIENRVMSNTSLDANQNNGYDKLTQQVCIDPRENANGEKATFEQWKNVYCSSHPDDCDLRLEPDKLVAKFLKEYPRSKDDDNKEEWQKFPTENFSDFLGKLVNWHASKNESKEANKQVTKIKDIAKTYKETFKGYKFNENGDVITSKATSSTQINTDKKDEKKIVSSDVKSNESKIKIPLPSNAPVASPQNLSTSYDYSPSAPVSPVADPSKQEINDKIDELTKKVQTNKTEADSKLAQRAKAENGETAPQTNEQVSEDNQRLAELELNNKALKDQIAKLSETLAKSQKGRSIASVDEDSSENAESERTNTSNNNSSYSQNDQTRNVSQRAMAPVPQAQMATLFSDEGTSAYRSKKGSPNIASFAPQKLGDQLNSILLANQTKPSEAMTINDVLYNKIKKEVEAGHPIKVADLEILLGMSQEQVTKIREGKIGSLTVSNGKDKPINIQVIEGIDESGKVITAFKPRMLKLIDLQNFLNTITN